MSGLKEFLETSSIHGLVYLATTEKVTRLVWMFVVMAGFSGAAVLIQQSLSSWEANPVSTTLKIRPIEEIPFPRVTVCPPENTFTTLNLDMETMETKTLDQLTKKALNDTLPSVIFDSDFEEKLSYFSKATNVSRGWYLGDTQISFLSEEDDYVNVKLRSSALSGTVSTPFFNEEFNQETFKRNMTFRIEIDKPNISHDNTTIDIKMDFDTEKQIIGKEWEIVKLSSDQVRALEPRIRDNTGCPKIVGRKDVTFPKSRFGPYSGFQGPNLVRTWSRTLRMILDIQPKFQLGAQWSLVCSPHSQPGCI